MKEQIKKDVKGFKKDIPKIVAAAQKDMEKFKLENDKILEVAMKDMEKYKIYLKS